MARCRSCSAPLPANINRCTYCNVRNDIDLHGRHQYSIKTKHSDRICPHCEVALQTIKLSVNGSLFIERCNTCFGLFFDSGEIEALLESSVSNVFEINFELINNINKDRYQNNKDFKYVKCPVCQIHMNRVNFGRRSGVIIDQCKKHGVWLDSGEITHLMEWKKAGGGLLNAQKKEKRRAKKKPVKFVASRDEPFVFQHKPKTQETDLLNTVSSLVYKLFG